MHAHTNKLINETSPYLLQHAHNPVDWYPWGEEAFQKAIDEDKPVLVSIGYAACHWCHVMERESFEDQATAALMNEHFINIKIDREERPDLDHIYMDAVQAMSGSGGWPLNVFLTPSKKPFYGGTYFPPVRAFNRASWKEVLTSVLSGFREKRAEIDEQADKLTSHLEQANSFGFQELPEASTLFTAQKADEAATNILQAADTNWGGFGRAPKFPQSFSIQFLLRFHHARKHLLPSNEEAHALADAGLAQALLSLDKMIEGGIYDQLGGGFARYSTDTEWLAPHFEKMLYDNALLVSVLSEAYQLTKKPRYREVIAETIGFVRRELMHPEFGFYAALDADSEGEEGRFYVWQKPEVEALLGPDAEIFCAWYDITEKGNWEKKNILRVKNTLESFAADHNIEPANLLALLARSRQKLMAERGKRVRPALDDKVILGWNALMNTALSKAFAATGEQEYRQLAVQNMKFLLGHLGKQDGEPGFMHTWKAGEARYPAFLDDYAFLLQALLLLQEITADSSWLTRAIGIGEHVADLFSEPGTGYFFYTPLGQADIIVRKKEVYDGAVPSGNAIMADCLYRMGILADRGEWRERSEMMLAGLGHAITKYPTSFGCWNILLLEMITGTAEIAIVGKGFAGIHEEILKEFIPNRVLMATAVDNQTFPLLAGKQALDNPLVYVCRNFACLQPVASTGAVMSLINRVGR